MGFDPGGFGAFGWAVAAGDRFPLRLLGHGTADHSRGALEAALACSVPEITAVGVDAPLFWSPASDRRVDQIVRKAITQLGGPGGTVNAVNSLRGACLVQGMLVAMTCRQGVGCRLPITEAHPKALLWLVRKTAPAGVTIADVGDYVVGNESEATTEHERDAALGAVSAFAMVSGQLGWRDLYNLESESVTPLDPPPGYWMPL